VELRDYVRFAVLLLPTLLAAADPQADQAATPQPEELAQAGNYKAALEGFRQRVAADPGDLDGRVWIAWLHDRMGRPDLAEPVYRAVVLEAPGHVDAAIQFAAFLTKQRHHDEAVRVLERAKSAEPRNPDLLAALGSAHLRVSNAKLALAYLELAAALSPTPENVNALKRARRAHRSSPQRSADVVSAGS
jgi:tetratricopeptide (TPR) repeat protein